MCVRVAQTLFVWMRINFIVAAFNELLLFALCHILMESFLKKKIHLEPVRLLFGRSDEWKRYVHIKRHDNGTSTQRHWKTLEMREDRQWHEQSAKTHSDTYVRKLMHIVAVIYNLNTRLLMATSATISKCVYVYVFNVENFIVSHKLKQNHLLLFHSYFS